MRNLDAWFVEYGSRQKYRQTDTLIAIFHSPIILRAEKICYTHILCYFPLHNIQTLISDQQAVGRK